MPEVCSRLLLICEPLESTSLSSLLTYHSVSWYASLSLEVTRSLSPASCFLSVYVHTCSLSLSLSLSLPFPLPLCNSAGLLHLEACGARFRSFCHRTRFLHRGSRLCLSLSHSLEKHLRFLNRIEFFVLFCRPEEFLCGQDGCPLACAVYGQVCTVSQARLCLSHCGRLLSVQVYATKYFLLG